VNSHDNSINDLVQWDRGFPAYNKPPFITRLAKVSSAAVKSNTLQVPPNTAIEVVLKTRHAGEVRTQYGPRVLFTTIDNEQLWLNPEEAHKIHVLGLAQNEPMRSVSTTMRHTARKFKEYFRCSGPAS
jgi:hypothetical protein